MSADTSGISERDVSSDIMVILPKTFHDSSVFIYTQHGKFFQFKDQPPAGFIHHMNRLVS
jgi:hypothetical protein